LASKRKNAFAPLVIMASMARRSGNGNISTKNSGKPDRCGKLIVSKHGVYLVSGGTKLKSLQLIPWEQLLCSLPPSRP
jgi:hypothetical protein